MRDSQKMFPFWLNITDRLVDSTPTQRVALFCLMGKRTLVRNTQHKVNSTYFMLEQSFIFSDTKEPKLWRFLAYEKTPILWERVEELCPSLAGVE
jgi:hypothetical protein